MRRPHSPAGRILRIAGKREKSGLPEKHRQPAFKRKKVEAAERAGKPEFSGEELLMPVTTVQA
jgi:hypothetical protein